MIRINLLPVKASRRQEAARRDMALGVLGLIVALALCVVGWVFQGARISEAQAEKAELDAEIARLTAIAARVDEMEKLKGDLQKKLDVIQGLKSNKQGPVRMLDELASATPEKLHVDLVDEKGGRLKLTGIGVSHEVISQFLANLERSDWFDEVYLVKIEQKEFDGVKLKVYELTARFVVPPAEAAKAAAASAKPSADETDDGGAQ